MAYMWRKSQREFRKKPIDCSLIRDGENVGYGGAHL
jgi:hypothetical protein